MESHHRFIFVSNIYRSPYHIVTFCGIVTGRRSVTTEMNKTNSKISKIAKRVLSINGGGNEN